MDCPGDYPPTRDAHDGVIGLGPAVCENCLFARLFDPNGDHHCTGATTTQTIGHIITPSTPQECPCSCRQDDGGRHHHVVQEGPQ
ncbi:hypothetical protein [Streptomyces scopuliridis]|uniref:hypothetical protein n=1 Tax=Streptomyces scopuliridis TaxID=452529 RepID=UPI0036A4CB7B